MKFVDSIEIFIRSGDGGAGMVSFRSARNKPKLGADGGDGGFGGDVYFVADSQLNTLSHLRYRQHYRAGDGSRGGSNNKTGSDGQDRLIRVPLGTEIFDISSGKKIAEVIRDSETVLVARGGKRGLGNYRYLSSTRQAPEEFTSGGKGIELCLRLELKLIADIGFAGLPNAGKSTLLSVLSAAKPKIADYPFTTVEPYLGVCEVDDRSFVVADIPGLIEGASEGKGLGHEFLKHLERTAAIAYIIAISSDHESYCPIKSFETLRNELFQYNPVLAAKQGVVVFTKSDLMPDAGKLHSIERIQEKIRGFGFESILISAVTGENVDHLKRLFSRVVSEQRSSSSGQSDGFVTSIEIQRPSDESSNMRNFLEEYQNN